MIAPFVWTLRNWQGAAVGLVLGIAFGFTAGFFKGQASARIKQLEGTVEAHETRNKIDDAVSRAGDYDLCIRLGGLPDDCDKLRRVETPSSSKEPCGPCES